MHGMFMAKNLIIVESPAKARTISKFLGKEYTVKASMGHVRDLPSSILGFDPENGFAPQYEISKDKKKTVAELKKQIDKKTKVYLATDEDREGEAISWHLLKALGLEKSPVKRIVFHEITKSAILSALENPRELDQQLVDAQQARRILDRAVGYELSPLLWKKIKPGLSAGRVQSVSIYILVEREKEIRKFKPEEYWKIRAEFSEFSAELKKLHGKPAKVVNETEAKAIESSVRQGDFVVHEIEERMTSRNPGAPFTTSTIQQEASVKLGFSVKRTMVVAQQLYEGNFDNPDYNGGLITYMRTDSVVLAKQALTQAQEVISEYGPKFVLKEPRFFKNRSTNAQEAHEAIRPVDFSLKPSTVKGLSSDQYRLYSLIWKRALASQMSVAEIARTTIKIEAGANKECLFEAKGQRVVFPGFLKAYTEGTDDPEESMSEKDVILPKVEKDQVLTVKDQKSTLVREDGTEEEIEGRVKLERFFTKPPPRYTEASLVKKMESEGIGRPSTFAPTISTIQDRGYVDVTPEKRLKPTSIGEVVTDFLRDHFPKIVNLGFTAEIERNFDRIANGEENWVEMMGRFYEPFHQEVEKKDKFVTRAEVLKRRKVGIDEESDKPVFVSMGKFGPMVQIGTYEDEEKPRFASLPSNFNLNEVTLAEAMKCFELPRSLGNYESDGEIIEIIVNNGRYGPYVKMGKDFFSLPEGEDPLKTSKETAHEIIREGLEKKAKNTFHNFGDIRVMNGRFGPYIKSGKKNYKIPKGVDPKKLDESACQEIITEAPHSKGNKGGKRRFIKKGSAKGSEKIDNDLDKQEKKADAVDKAAQSEIDKQESAEKKRQAQIEKEAAALKKKQADEDKKKKAAPEVVETKPAHE